MSEAEASLDYTHVYSLTQESVTSYPPKVLQCIVAKNRVMQVYNEESN